MCVHMYVCWEREKKAGDRRYHTKKSILMSILSSQLVWYWLVHHLIILIGWVNLIVKLVENKDMNRVALTHILVLTSLWKIKRKQHILPLFTYFAVCTELGSQYTHTLITFLITCILLFKPLSKSLLIEYIYVYMYTYILR